MTKSKKADSSLTSPALFRGKRLAYALLLVGVILGTCFSPAFAVAEKNVEKYLKNNEIIKREEKIIKHKSMEKFSIIMTIDEKNRHRGYIVWWDQQLNKIRFQPVWFGFLCKVFKAWACPKQYQ